MTGSAVTSPVARLPSPIMQLYSDFVRKYPRAEQQLQTILNDVFTPNADPFNRQSRHHRTWLHLQKMFPPTVPGKAALEAEVFGSDGDFSDAAHYEIDIKTELFKRNGIGGVIDSPLGADVARHYALLYGLLCDAVTKDLVDEIYADVDYARITKPPLFMPIEPYDDACYLCGFSFSTGVYGPDWVLWCCQHSEQTANGSCLCCRKVWHGRCAGLSWAPGEDTPFIGPCGHPCQSTMDAQRMQLDAIQETQMQERRDQVAGWQAVMDPDELISSPEAAMERSILGNVTYELDHFLHQASQLSSESQHSQKVAAKCALSHVLAQTHLLPPGAASKVHVQLQPHMHLLHIVETRGTWPASPEWHPPMSSPLGNATVIAEGQASQMDLIPVKKPVRRSSVASSKDVFVDLCLNPDMIDAVDQCVGTWSIPSNITFAVHRIFCSNQAKLTGDKWTLSNVSTVLIPLTDSKKERLKDAKERTIVTLQLLLHLQKKKFLILTPDLISGNPTVKIEIVACNDVKTVPLIATSGFVKQSPHLWSDAFVEACISNFRKPKWKAQKRKRSSDVVD